MPSRKKEGQPSRSRKSASGEAKLGLFTSAETQTHLMCDEAEEQDHSLPAFLANLSPPHLRLQVMYLADDFTCWCR